MDTYYKNNDILSSKKQAITTMSLIALGDFILYILIQTSLILIKFYPC